MSRLRILCLHGFTSNGSVHAHQAQHITSALSSEYEFLFPDGPHKVDLATQMDLSSPYTKAWVEFVSTNSTAGHRAWWYAQDPQPETNYPGGFDGLEKSLGFIGQLIEQTGPVHAIWGFSQGACFAGLLTALLEDGNRGHPLRKYLPGVQGSPKAGIIFSGFKPRFKQYDSIYACGIETPTLHVVGEKDTAVTIERSEVLVEMCKRAEVLKHIGGHDLPKSEIDQETIVRFLREKVGPDGASG